MHFIFIGRKKEHKENASFLWNSSAIRDQLAMCPQLNELFHMVKWDAYSALTKKQVACVEEGIMRLESVFTLTDSQKTKINELAGMNNFAHSWDYDILGHWFQNLLLSLVILKWIRHHHQKWYGDKLAGIFIGN